MEPKPEDGNIIVVWNEEDSVFVASDPELEGCVAHGESKEKALSELKLVRKDWLEIQDDRSRRRFTPTFD